VLLSFFSCLALSLSSYLLCPFSSYFLFIIPIGQTALCLFSSYSAL
jgi:hypothetical protein